ncbi:MAG TPA: hypothetical protein VMM56_00055 [Planctomycetaceae bacterium]|nr:hypothetical protein [Planctomycetaceae bacterium]
MLFLLSLLSFFAFPLSHACGEDDPDIDLPYVIERSKEWRSSFVNLHLSWELRSLSDSNEQPLPEWLPPADWENARMFFRFEWIWADHGMSLLESESFLDPEGGSRRTLDVYNVEKEVAFRANYQRPETGEESLKELRVRGLGVGKGISAKAIAPLNGVYWPGAAIWLPEVLASRASWKLDGFENISGVRCTRIVGRPFENKVDDESVETLWLDPSRDYLVRRYLTSGQISAPLDFIVDEFQQLPSGIWFPKLGRIQLHSNPYENQLWVVTDVALNEATKDEKFTPPEPEIGTLVDRNGMVFKQGDSSRTAQSLNAPNSETTPLQDLYLAKPPSSHWFLWSIALAITSVLFLIAGLWFRRKQLEDQS